jgi:hypothetical protein
VTGPGLPGEGAQNTAQNGPVGGVLLKVPRSDFTQKREYMAIAYKFPETFDPVSNQSDRNQLAKACGTREWVSNPPAPANGGRWEVATFSIYSNFTIDFAKIDSSSTFTWPTASDGNINFNWAGSSNSFPANNAGLKYGSSALNPVAQSVKVAYKPTSMPIYNFYSFRFSDLQTLGNIWTGPNAAIAIVDDNIGNTFWSKKIITKSRMIGEMPYLKRDSNDLYTGNTKFGTIGSSTLTNYLGSSAPAIAIGDTLPASWTSAIGGAGIDRLGFTCFGTWMSGSNKFRWGPSFSSGSWVFPRNITSRTFTFDDTCLGYGDVNSAPNGLPANTTIKTVYRDIWVRSYNQNNTQIQQVYIAER